MVTTRVASTLSLLAAMLAATLGIATPAFAGDSGADDDDRRGPQQGVTYTGRSGGLSVRITAIGPTTADTTQTLVHLRLRCGDDRRPQVDEKLPGTVEADGSFEIEKDIEETGGGTFDVEIDVEGRFTSERSTTARFSYDLYDEDDDGNVDACDDKGDLELQGGRAAPGLERVEVAIPIDVGDDADGGPIAATTNTVVAAIGQTDSAGGDLTELVAIDPATNEVTSHQSVPIDLNGLVGTGSSLYGIDADNGTLIPIDPGSLARGTPIPIAPPRQTPQDEDWALWPAGAVYDGAIWLAATRDQELVRVDPATGAVVARFPLDAHPQAPVAGPDGLYVETQTTPLFAAPSGKAAETNTIRRIDPASGATIATSAAYLDGSLGGCVGGPDGVVCSVTAAVSEPDQLVELDPETLDERASARLQYPLAVAPPGVWTLSIHNDLRGLAADLTPEVEVPDVATAGSQAGVGFGAIWVYNDAQRSLYRITTS